MEYIPYIIDSFRGGISDEQTRGIKGAFKYAYGVDIHKRRDSLSCNWAMLTIGTSTQVNDLVKYTIQGRDGSTYAMGNAGSVYAISGKVDDPVLTYVYTDYNGEIKGAAEWKQSDGNTYLHWATNTSIARMTFNGSPDMPLTGSGVVTADYIATLDSADYHPMKNAAGQLNIGNGNFLAVIDYQGNWNNASMNLRPGNIIKTLDERDDYVLIGTERGDEAEEGHIWAWVTTDLNWFKKKKIPVKGVNALIDTERLLLQGGINGEIFYSDFANTAPLNSIPNGGQINPGGITVYNDLALMGFYGAGDQSGLYSYGRKSINRPFVLNQEFRLKETSNGNTVKEIGSIWMNSAAVFASWKSEGSTTYYGIDMASTTTRASARIEGLEFTGESPHLNKHFKSLKAVMEPLPSGTSLSVIYKANRATTSGDDSNSSAGSGWRYARVGSGTDTTFSTTDITEVDFTIDANGRVFEVGVEMTPSGMSTPEVTALVGYISKETEEYGS